MRRKDAGAGADQSATTGGRNVVQFAGFHLDPRSGELWNNGTRHTLAEQPLAVLLALLEHPGELVTREELRQRLWPGDTFVDFEHGLNAAVKRLRDALDDSADSPQFIETLPRRGYRFIPGPEGGSLATGRRSPERFARSRAMLFAVAFIVLAAAAVWSTLQQASRRGRGAAEPSLRRVTFAPGVQAHPTWSPDGRHLGYASDQTGNFEIWVQPVSGGDPHQVTHSSAQDTEPDWSPLDARLVFRRSAPDAGLFVAAAFGGLERRLTSFGVAPRWSPDGSRILFASTDEVGNGVLPRLFIIPANGGTPEEVLKPFLDNVADVGNVSWHPDGRRLSVFATKRGETQRKFFTVDLSGAHAEEWQIGSAKGLPPSVEIVGAEWDRSGSAIYLLTTEPSLLQPNANIWRLTLDPGAHKALTAARLTSGEGVYSTHAVAKNSGQLAFASTNESVRLWSFPLAGSDRVEDARGQPLTPRGARAPDLAKDDRSLLYVLPASRGEGTELWLKDLVTNTVRSAGPAQPSHWAAPHWSPDGQMVAYWSVTLMAPPSRDSEQGLAVWRVENGSHEFLMTPRREAARLRGQRLAMPTDWSPDGTSVLASSDLLTPRFSIGLWPLASAPRAEAAVTTLAADPAYNLWQGRFSADGKWIAFVAQKYSEPGAMMIAVMPRAGTEASRWRVITDPHGLADKPRWSHDGRTIYYIRADRGFYSVWAQRFDGASGGIVGSPVQITHFDNPEFRLWEGRGTFELCVSSNRLILPMSETTAGSIWVIDNAK